MDPLDHMAERLTWQPGLIYKDFSSAKGYFGLFLQSLEYTHAIQSFEFFSSTNLELK